MRILYTILFSFSFFPGFSQFTLGRGNKKIAFESTKILGFRSSSIIVTSFAGFEYSKKTRDAFSEHIFYTNSILSSSSVSGEIIVSAKIISFYVDSISGEHYTSSQMYNRHSKGYFTDYPVYKDTAFQTKVVDIKSVVFQTREPRRAADGLGVLGAFLIGTAATISGTVYLIKGNNDGFIPLAFGSFLLAQVRHWIRKSQWFKRYETGEKKWSLKYN